MTDKQIIIDGVDVSGCIHYEEYFEEDEDIKIKDFCALWYNSCHSCNNHTCYYKLYSRKEQECEELKKANDEKNELLIKLGCPTTATAKRKVNCLEQQLDQLKETNEGLLSIQYKLADNNKQLRQTLEEIKEIAEIEMDSKEFIAVQCMLNGSADNKNKVLKKILQKINEVENGNI